MSNTVSGLPGVQSTRTMTPRSLLALAGATAMLLPGFHIIDGTKSGDAGNTPDVDVLRTGLLMGKITTGGKYAESVLGVSTGAITGASTTVTAAAETVTELVRRIGASGTFKLTGPPTANGTARTLTATYSAASTTNITVTALGVAQVDRIRFGTAATGGNLQLTIQKPDGTLATTGSAAWNATDATYLASINTALDTASGVSGAIVATAISAVDTDFGIELTYALASYPAGATAAQVALLPTGATSPVYTRTTANTDGRFVSGSFIQPTDGSEAPRGVLSEDFPLKISDQDAARQDQDASKILVGGFLLSSKIVNWPTDTGLQAWIVSQLNTYGRFVFDHSF